MDEPKVKLTREEVAALAWASSATGSPQVNKNYNDKRIYMLIEMSFVRHQILNYELVIDVMPECFDDVDHKLNSQFFPETKEEKAWGVRSVTHRKLSIDIDNSSQLLVQELL